MNPLFLLLLLLVIGIVGAVCVSKLFHYVRPSPQLQNAIAIPLLLAFVLGPWLAYGWSGLFHSLTLLGGAALIMAIGVGLRLAIRTCKAAYHSEDEGSPLRRK